MREGQNLVPTESEWLISEFPQGGRIGADPKLVSASMWNLIKENLQNSSIELVEIYLNLIDVIWTDHQMVKSDKSVFVWDVKYAGIFKDFFFLKKLEGKLVLFFYREKLDYKGNGD